MIARFHQIACCLFGVCLLSLWAWSQWASSSAHDVQSADQVSPTQVRERYTRLPLRFEQNVGQTNGEVQFLARGQGYNLFLTATEAVLTFKRNENGPEKPTYPAAQPSVASLRMKLLDANPAVRVTGTTPLPGLSHYLQGRQQWRNIHNFAQVLYEEVWPGIDLIYYGQQQQLEYDFRLAPGAAAERIRWQVTGAQAMRLDEQGNLLLQVGDEMVTWQRPQAWQKRDGVRQTVACDYQLEPHGCLSFKLGEYDRRLPLVIDPTLAYLRYVGGLGAESGQGIAVDESGAAYVCGQTDSLDFPGATPVGNARQREAFVVKLNPAGTSIVYATYFGGANDDFAQAIAVDAAGNAYITGTTASSDLPVTANAAQRSLAGGADGFVAKFNAAGSALVYASYLGGSDDDYANDVALDTGGNAYLTGATFSTNFPGTNTSVGKAGTSLYRSADQAANWNASANGLAVSEIIALAVAPQNTNTIFAASRTALYRSTDGGAQWQRLGAPPIAAPQLPTPGNPEDAERGIFGLALDPQNAATLYLATREGMFKSLDGGATYMRKSTGLPNNETVYTVSFAPGANGLLYAGTWRGVYRSTNGGESWSALNGGLENYGAARVRQLVFEPANAAIAYAATVFGIFKTANGGTNWTLQSTFTSNGPFAVAALALDPLAPQTLYAGGYSYAPTVLFKTTDGGSNWQPSQNGLLAGNLLPHPGVRALAITPNNSTVVYAATDHGVYKTTNGGGSWNLSTNGLPSRNVYALAFSSGGTTLLAGADAGSDTFVTKLNAAGTTWLYTALLGGSENEKGNSLALDAAGNVWLAGATQSRDLPRIKALQDNVAGGTDVLVAKLNAAGNNWLFATPLGGAANDEATALALDGAGNAYVTGFTESLNFPTVKPLFNALTQFPPDAFVTKLKADATAIEYSTYLGGNSSDAAYGIAVDTAGNAVVTGSTFSDNFPRVGALQSFFVRGFEMFVSRLNPTGARLLFSTYLGGGNDEQGNDITVDARGNLYLVGTTSSPNLAVGSNTPMLKGGTDALVVKLAPAVELAVTMTDQPDPVRFGSNLSYTLTVANRGEIAATGVTLTNTLPTGARLVSATAGQGTCSGTATITCNLGTLAIDAQTNITLVINPPAQREITNTATVSSNEPDGASGNNTASAITTVDYADVALMLTPSLLQAAPGSRLSWLLTVRNPGPSTVENIVVTDVLPAQVMFVSCQVTGGVCGSNGNARTLTIPTLAANTSVTATLHTILNNNLTPGSSIINSAQLGALTIDPVASNNFATTSVAVIPANTVPPQNGRLLYTTLLDSQSVVNVVNADGTRAMPVNGVSGVRLPLWSPDGTRLVVNGDGFQSFILNADGTFNKNVPLSFTSATVLCWSPDSTRFVINYERALYVINTDGTHVQRIHDIPAFGISELRWSPDGLKLAFTQGSLYTLNADGSELKRLADALNGNGTDDEVTWSPNSTKIVFSSHRSDGLSYKLYSINSDGTGLTKLTDGPNDRSPVFAPDGTKIAFARNGELYTMNPDGSSVRPLGNPIIRGYRLDWQRLPVGPQPNYFLLSGRFADVNGRVYPTTMRLSGTRNFEAPLDSRGVYTFGLLPEGGNYTVTPGFVPGGSVEPATRTYSNLRSDINDANFTLAAIYYSISGRVTDRAGVGLGGLQMILRGPTDVFTVTDAEGKYSFPFVRGGIAYGVQANSYNARDTPQPVGPAGFSSLDGNKVVNFVGDRIAFTVSGTILNGDNSALSGVTLMLSAGNQTYTASSNSTGRYSFSNIPVGYLYTLRATKDGVTIAPASRSFILNSEQPLNFFAGATSLAAVSAANFSPQHLAFGGMAALFGSGLASTTKTALGLPLPTELEGVSVTITVGNFNDFPCALFFISPQQINFAPFPGLFPPVGGAALLSVKRNGRVVAAGMVQLETLAPALFSANANGLGVAAAVALRVKANGTQVYEAVARLDPTTKRYVTAPLDLSVPNEQVFLILFGTGFRFKNDFSYLAASIDGTPASVAFVGAQSETLVGLDQANLLIPNSLVGRGEVGVTLTVDGKTSNPVKIALR
jgi:uncharacterized protein (TIGR03437 family)